MTRFAISGFASLDHVIELDGMPSSDATTLITRRSTDAWPRLGGSPSYVAGGLVRGGHREVSPISWVGGDPLGETYIGAMAALGAKTDGIEVLAGSTTPMAILAYLPSGSCMCLYDPASSFHATLSPAQRAIVAAADWVCVTVGPPEATLAVIDAVRPDAKLVWAVKHDRKSMRDPLLSRLATRADVISHSRGEAQFVADALSGTPSRERLMVRTLGPEGAELQWRGTTTLMPSIPVTAADPTGAGDTFIGGLVAALAVRPEAPLEAVRAGIEAARALLLARRTAGLEGQDRLRSSR